MNPVPHPSDKALRPMSCPTTAVLTIFPISFSHSLSGEPSRFRPRSFSFVFRFKTSNYVVVAIYHIDFPVVQLI